MDVSGKDIGIGIVRYSNLPGKKAVPQKFLGRVITKKNGIVILLSECM